MSAKYRVELQRSLGALLTARTVEEREAVLQRLTTAARKFAATPLPDDDAKPAELKAQFRRAAASSERLLGLSDAALAAFNQLLPWAAMTLDGEGRPIGGEWSSRKRGSPQSLMDARIAAWNAAYPLKGKTVLELGCFEGIHTHALLRCGASVIAADSRPENVIKTLTRLWLYELNADILLWDLEELPPPAAPAKWDALAHIGVLYHLSDPVGHLHAVLPKTREAVLLDTHVARPEEVDDAYEVAGRSWAFRRYAENIIDVSPFAGMRDHAKWLLEADLLALLSDRGFSRVEVVQRREERNGLRVQMRAFR